MVRFLWLVLAAALAGCACTAVGCFNRIQFAPGVDLVPGIAYHVDACFDDTCHEANVEAGQNGRAGVEGALTLWANQDTVELALGDDPGDLGGSHDVMFTIRDDSDELVAEYSNSIELVRTEPNGGWPCGPTCWSADIRP